MRLLSLSSLVAAVAALLLSAAPATADRPPKTRPVIVVGGGDPPTTLKTKDLRVGKGARRARRGDELTVRYVGANWSDSVEFDSSWDRGDTFSFPLGSGDVIAGWDRGIVGMREGGRRQLIIPPALGYGAEGSPPAIGPNETLVFVVDLVKIRRR